MQQPLDEEQSIGSQNSSKFSSRVPSEKVFVCELRMPSAQNKSPNNNLHGQSQIQSRNNLPVKLTTWYSTPALINQNQQVSNYIQVQQMAENSSKHDDYLDKQTTKIELPCILDERQGPSNQNSIINQKNNDISIQEDLKGIDMIQSIGMPSYKKTIEEDTQKTTVKKNRTLSRSLKSSSSFIFDDEYFVEDQKQEYLKKQQYMNPELFHKLRDHEVEWSFSVFFEFLLYHVLFYIVLGPFIIIPLYRQKILLENLSFWGNKAQFYIQSVTYFLNALNLILFFTSDNSHIYHIEIIYMEVVVFLRAYIIACKYATLHPDKIELYRKYVLTGDLTANDFYFARWIFQKDITIYREAYNAMQRGEFDASLFYMSFFVEPRAQYKDEIEENVENLRKWHKYEKEEFQPARVFKQENSVFGYGVLSYIIKNFAEKNPNLPLAITAVGLAILRGFLLFVYRYIAKDEQNLQFTKTEIVQMVGIIYNTSFGYFSSFIFLIFFTKDLRMKDYCQKQCLLILSPKRMSLGIKKTLPTINFLDPFSLKAWSTMRRVLLDYGKPYYLRLEAFITIYVLVTIISLAALLLWLFKAYELPQNIGVACGFESFFILAFLLFILVQGAKINSNFDKFKNVLIDYRVLFDDLIRLRQYYFMDGSKSTNVIRSRTIQKIKNQLSVDNKPLQEEEILKCLRELNNGLDDCAKELDQDYNNQPFLFMGIKITTVLVQNVLVGIGTTTVAVVQYYLSQKMN